MDEKKIEPWRKVWRKGLSPCLSETNLLALEKALATNDPRLIQGATCVPPPLQCVQDWPVEAACPLGYMGAMEHGGLGLDPTAATVAQAEEFFAAKCYEADVRLSEPAGCRWLLEWWDDSPRGEALPALLEEVRQTLAEREAAHAS